MNKSDEYILSAIKKWVWSGFYSHGDVDDMIGDILDEEANEALLRAAVLPEFEKKATIEPSWPRITDCDRLDSAFQELNSHGIIALQNAGYTMSDGISDVAERLHERGREKVRGYCFYHGQDLERAMAGEGLTLAFGDLDDNHGQKTEIGRLVKEVVERAGFVVEWDGNPESRLNIPQLDWKRRGHVS